MKTQQSYFINNQWTELKTDEGFNAKAAQLVLAFGASDLIADAAVYNHLKSIYAHASIVSASTSGEILGESVYDNSVVVTAVQLDKTSIHAIGVNVKDFENSYLVGAHLIKQLNTSDKDLAAVFVISDGTKINGSELVSGLNTLKTNKVAVTGGLAGDAARFSKTYTGLNEPATEGNIIAVGFYGKHLNVGHGSFGGWDEFGRERIITKSHKNVLYELDGNNALDLYKEYLGPYVDELPGSALLFPLSLKVEDAEKNLVRTILSIDEYKKSMTFAGNLPEGSKVRLMKANFEKLIHASSVAAEFTKQVGNANDHNQLAILISCVGRKLILQERTFEEVEAAKKVLGNETSITGFYSYGEISPFNPGVSCELHNQTMTITTFSED